MKPAPLNFSGYGVEGAETRSALDNPQIGLYSDQAFNIALGEGWTNSVTGEVVNERTALGIAAIWCAVQVLAESMAMIPLQVFKKTTKGPVKFQRNPLYKLVHDQVNADFLTSFEWRHAMMTRLLIKGRAYTFIERDGGGRVSNLWPLDPDRVTPFRQNFKRKYRYRREDGKEFVYDVSEIIDLCWMRQSDGLGHYDPLQIHADTISLMISATKYAAKTYQNGGVPPIFLRMPVSSPGAVARATDDVQAMLKESGNRQRNVAPLPPGFEPVVIGLDPAKTQMLEVKKFNILETARIFKLPPTFLMDLSTGTYSNTEQMDLAFVKHALHPWIERWEQELNSKLFQGKDQSSYVEFNVDGLQRGDFASRMAGYATAIQTAILTPDEVRSMENRPAAPGGDQLLIQGATVPLTSAGQADATTEDPQDQDPVDPGDTGDQ